MLIFNKLFFDSKAPGFLIDFQYLNIVLNFKLCDRILRKYATGMLDKYRKILPLAQ